MAVPRTTHGRPLHRPSPVAFTPIVATHSIDNLAALNPPPLSSSGGRVKQLKSVRTSSVLLLWWRAASGTRRAWGWRDSEFREIVGEESPRRGRVRANPLSSSRTSTATAVCALRCAVTGMQHTTASSSLLSDSAKFFWRESGVTHTLQPLCTTLCNHGQQAL